MAWDISWGIHSMISCSGWTVSNATNLGPVSFDVGSPCMMAKLGMVILFFIIAMTRKWGGEEVGMEFDFLWACILGLGLYILAITFTGSFKLAMVCGIAGMLAAGYGAGYVMGGGDGGYSGE